MDGPDKNGINASVGACRECIGDNVLVPTRLTNLRSSESFGQIECLGKQFFNDISDVYNSQMGDVRIIYITNLIPLCITQFGSICSDSIRTLIQAHVHGELL
jgi:hypothetical protein